MLIDFTVENYKSIKDSMTFTMEATAIKDHSENIFEDGKKTLLKSAVIYGPNASGKSNLLNAMNFMRNFINYSATEYKQNDTIDVEPFKLNSHTENQPSLFETTFVSNEIRYRYGFRLDNNIVHDEWLFQTKVRETKLFIRTKQEFDLSTSFSEGRLIAREDKTRNNALFLSVVAQFNGNISNEISNWFNQFNITSNVNKNKFEHYTLDMLKEQTHKSKILNLLLSVDMGIKDVEMQTTDVEYEKVPSFVQQIMKDDKAEKSKITQSEIITKHMQYNEQNEYIGDIEFKLKNESTGTKKFLLLAGPIVETLDNGEILVIDELDNSFHTQLTEFIIELFNSKETNPKNAQLIFATHDTNLLTHKLFRRDQIWFVEKNIYGESEIFSLIDFGARKDTSLEKNYLEGKFGGVPHIYNLYAESIDNGTEDRHKIAKAQRKRTIKKTKSISKRVLIACEDTKSSRFYFTKMIKDYGLRGKVTFAKHIGTNPMKVLEAIKVHLSKDSNFDEKWIVIDKDSYSKTEFKGTIESARALNINVAYANEAYELWILLHFKEQKAHINRFQLNKELKTLIDYEKNNEFIYEIVKSKQSEAMKRSKNLIKYFTDINGCSSPFNDNPSNTIYQLVESLEKLKTTKPSIEQ